MTTTDRQKLIRLLLPLLAILVGMLITAVAFLAAMFASGSCNCDRPIALAFPFATILWGSGHMQWLGGAVMAFQFPVYALLVALGRSRSSRARHALILVGIHVVAVLVALLVFKGQLSMKGS